MPPYWRCNSNNSVAVYQIRSLDDNFWDLYSGNSECYGLINLPLCRSAGQVGSETATPKVDPDVVCVNPCGEYLATLRVPKTNHCHLQLSSRWPTWRRAA